jgi:hypothetical protein
MKKLLIFGIIALFIGLAFIPSFNAVSISKKIDNITSVMDDSKWIATLSMNFTDEIKNINITHIEEDVIPQGFYRVDVLMDFNCPEDRKIEIDYYYNAYLYYSWLPGLHIDFCENNNTKTIINGSNPPTFNNTYTEFIYEGTGSYRWVLHLIINATLRGFSYIDGEWVLVKEQNSSTEAFHKFWVYKNKNKGISNYNLEYYKQIQDILIFNDEISNSEEDCIECQSDGKTHLADKLLNKMEKNEILSNVINLNSQVGDRPICSFLLNTLEYYKELYVKYMDLAYTNPDGPYFWFYFSLGMTCGVIIGYISIVATFLLCWGYKDMITRVSAVV